MTESKYHYRRDVQNMAQEIHHAAESNLENYLNFYHQGGGEITCEITSYRHKKALLGIQLWGFADDNWEKIDSINKISRKLSDTLRYFPTLPAHRKIKF